MTQLARWRVWWGASFVMFLSMPLAYVTHLAWVFALVRQSEQSVPLLTLGVAGIIVIPVGIAHGYFLWLLRAMM